MKLFSFSKINLAITVLSIYLLIVIIYLLTGDIKTLESIPPGFIDLDAIISSAECYKLNFNPYIDRNDICKWDYNYPLIWLDVVNFFNISKSHVPIIGISLIVIFLILFIGILTINSKNEFILYFFYLISPGVLFLLERSNCDLIIFLIIMLVFFYLRKKINPGTYNYIICVTIIFLSFLKIYPVFLLPIIFFLNNTLKNKILLFATSSSILFSYFFLIRKQLNLISLNSHYPSELAFGRNVWLQEFLTQNELKIVSLLPFITLFFIVAFIYKKKTILNHFINDINVKSIEGTLFTSSLLLYLGIFLIGNHYDFRLIFLSLSFPQISILYHSNIKYKKIIFLFIVSFIFISLASFLHRGIIPFQNYKQWFIGRNTIMIIKYIITSFYAAFAFLFILIHLFFIYKKQIK